MRNIEVTRTEIPMEKDIDDTNIDFPGVGISKIGASTILSPRTSLTFANYEECEALLKRTIEKNQTTIIIDCKSVEFMDSKALEMMIHTQEELRSRGGVLKIANLNAVCRDILIVTRLINVFDVYEDIPGAVKSKS
jgi:anti-anti-sigma factor